MTRVGTSPLADVPRLDLGDLPDLGRLRYLTPSTAGTSSSTRDGTAATLLGATGGDPERSLLWQECLCGLGVTDVASVVCADRFGCWAWLDLWRTRATYTPDETAFLADVAPVLTMGLREAQARTFVDDAAALDLYGPAVIVLDPDPRSARRPCGRPRHC